jgi:hypothetical protein
VRQTAHRIGDLVAHGLHQPGGVGAGCAGADLLAQHGAHGELLAVHGPGHASSGSTRHPRREHLVLRQLRVHRHGIRVEVEQATATGHRGGQVAQVGEREPAGDVGRLRGEGDDAGAVRQPEGPAVRPGAPLLDARHRGGRQVSEQAVRPERRPEGQPQRERPGRGGRRRPPAQLSWGEREDLLHRVVELPDAAEAGSERDLSQRQVGGLDEGAGRLRPLRPGQGQRTAPSSASSTRSTCRRL